MNLPSQVTLGDFIGPETLAELGLSETAEPVLSDRGNDREIEHMMGTDMSQYQCWKQLWLYGIVVDDDMNYYIPDDYDTTVSLISLDNPPKVAS